MYSLLRRRRGRVGSFMPPPLYSPGNRPRYSLARRLGGPTGGLDAVEKRESPVLQEIQLRFLGLPVGNCSLYRLSYSGFSPVELNMLAKCDGTRLYSNGLHRQAIHVAIRCQSRLSSATGPSAAHT